MLNLNQFLPVDKEVNGVQINEINFIQAIQSNISERELARHCARSN